MEHYNVNFKGYRRDQNKESLPHDSGIYMVYRCVYNSNSESVSLKEIIYIGKAEDINDRLITHEKRQDFLNMCIGGEELCYAYATVSLDDLDIVENALVFAQKPRLNRELKDSFNFEDCSFLIEGKCGLLKHTNFLIK